MSRFISLFTNPRVSLFTLLLVVAAVSRMGGLTHPRGVVFDEVHFGKYVTAYCCSGERIFDVHPPHAKLLISGVAWIAGYRGGVSFQRIGEPYGEVSPLPLRLVPALAGALLPPLIYLLLIQLGASTVAALFGGMLVLFDNALVVQSRLINLDVVLLAATFGALSLWLASERAVSAAGRRALSWASGGLAGLAVGCKLTGLLALGLPAVMVAAWWWRAPGWRRLGDGVSRYAQFLAVAVVVYLAGWWLHFHLLTQPGPADAWGRWSGSFFADLLQVHRDILAFNAGLSAEHGDGSRWWSWPWMGTPIYYWVEGKARIYLLGNPLVWWGGGLMLLVMAVNLSLGRASRLVARGESRLPLWFPLWGFAGAYLPFILIDRVMFLYHYLTPLLFSILAVVLWLDEIGWIRGEAGWRQRLSFYVVVVVAVALFAAISPLTYGTEWGSGIGDWIFARFPGWR